MKRYCPECETVYDDARCFILCPHELHRGLRAGHCAGESRRKNPVLTAELSTPGAWRGI
jgi:hypothetical protein